MVIYKKTKQWFNKRCKKAVQERDKANSLVVFESSEKNKRRLTQKQREMKKVCGKKMDRKNEGSI